MTAEMNGLVEEKTADKNEPPIESNEYSIYDYLKSTPSLLIAALSAIIAIATFFSKALAIISTREELAFWEIDAAFSSFGGDPITLRATASLLFSFGIILVSLWFSETYNAYIPYKRGQIALRHFITTTKKEIKQIKQTKESAKIPERTSNLHNSFSELCKSTQKYIRSARRMFLSNLAPIIFTYFFIFWIYIETISISRTKDRFLFAILFTAGQMLFLWLLSRISCAKIIDKKALKQENAICEVIEELRELDGTNTFPIIKLFSGGLRAVMKNAAIVSIVIALLSNCFLAIVIHTVLPNKPDLSDVPMRVVEIDSTRYALVYQIDNKYFLEEARIQEKHSDAETEYTLTVYTDQQRVISTDDIAYEIYEFKNIILANNIV